jgi:hypothetical protein
MRIFGDELAYCLWNAAVVAEHVVQHTELEVSVQRQTAPAHAFDDLSGALSIALLVCDLEIAPAVQQFQTLFLSGCDGSHLLCAARQQRQYRPLSLFGVGLLWWASLRPQRSAPDAFVR